MDDTTGTEDTTGTPSGDGNGSAEGKKTHQTTHTATSAESSRNDGVGAPAQGSTPGVHGTQNSHSVKDPGGATDATDSDVGTTSATTKSVTKGKTGKKKRKKSRAEKDLGKRLLFWGGAIVIIGFLATLLFTVVINVFGISFFAVKGNSMQPTLHHGDNIVLQQDDKVARDQIFLFTKPTTWGYMGDETPLLIKRTEAVTGNTLSYADGVFSVNGEVTFDTHEQDYECEPGVDTYEHQLTDQEIFVTGDNIHESLDSRRIFCDGDLENHFVSPQQTVNYGEVVTVF